jgi:hypothetical protein
MSRLVANVSRLNARPEWDCRLLNARNSHDLHSRFIFEVQIRQVLPKLSRQTTMRTIQGHHRQEAPNPRNRHNLLGRVIGVLLACALTACDSKEVRASTREVEGSEAERVAVISKMIGGTAPLPTQVLDAHFVEEQTGDGRLGPSEFAAFYALTVAPADLPAWRAALSQSKTWNHFANDEVIKRAAPKKVRPWWVSGADLGRLEFHSPHSLTGRANGWVGIAPDGRIFIYTFTL